MVAQVQTQSMRRVLRLPEALQRVQRFDETGPDGFHRSWIMLFPVGHYQHEQYGELDFTPAKLQKIKAQYDQRVRHIDAALDVDHRAAHDDSRATGWIESLELRDRQPDGTPAGLWGCIKWTPYGLKFLNADEYRYFSPEFGPWDDPQTGEQFEDVLIGGALTNRPFLKTMPAIALADRAADGAKGGGKNMVAISRKPWGSVDKACLPASCFLIVGDPAKKSTWRLPVYEGAGPRDANGNYTKRGALNLNGVKAAWAAVNGAHTGEPMSGVPASAIAKLKAWKAQYFPGDGAKTAKQAMEGRVSRKLGGLASVDTDLLDDEDDEEESLTLADGGNAGGKPAKGSAAMKAKMAALRAKSSLKLGKKKSGKDASEDDDSEDSEEMAEDEEDDNAEMAEDTGDDETYDEADGDGPDEELAEDDEDAEQYADAEDSEDDDVDPEDDEEEGDDEEETPKAKASRNGKRGAKQMSKRMMGARAAVSGGAHVRAAESVRAPLTLAEQRKLTEENARLKYQLYEVKVEETLALWKRGRFQFKENAKAAPKSGRIALSKAFSDAFRAWMRVEGVRLSDASRTRALELIEIALSSAVVDLSERGSSYDPEGRMVATARRKAGDDDRLQQAAERIALGEYGKSITALTEEPENVLAIYSRAAEEIRY